MNFILKMLKRFGVLGKDQSEGKSLVKLQRERGQRLLSLSPIEAGCGVGDAVVGSVMVF